MFRYKLQGLLVTSNCELPGLAVFDGAGGSDVAFQAGSLPSVLDVEGLQEATPNYVSPYCDPHGEPLSRMWRCPETGMFYFRFIEGFAFAVDADGRNIWAQWPEPVTLQDITAFLLGRILAFVMHLRGYVCLHASAAVIDGGAVLFGGFPGMGKSSTVAAFSRRGYAVLTDDVSAMRPGMDGRITVMPGIPRLCLWPDSVEFLFGSSQVEELPRLHPNEGKRVVRLDTSSNKFQFEPMPLAAVYLLAPRTTDTEAPRIETVSGSDRLIRLLYNGFMHLALDREQTARHFGLLGEIARSVHMQQLVPSSDQRKLDRMCELVAADVRTASLSPVGRSD